HQGYRTTHHPDRVMPAATWPMIPHRVELAGESTPAKDRTGIVLEEGELRITAIEVDHAPIAPAYAYRFDYKGRSVVITGDLKYHAPLAAAARGADVLVSEAIVPSMTQALSRARPAAIAPPQSCTTSRTTTLRPSRLRGLPTRRTSSCSPSTISCRRPTACWP